MIERDTGIAKLIEGGLEFKTAAVAFDILRPLFEAVEVDAARQERNRRYYTKTAEKRKADGKMKRELRRLKNPVKTPIKTVKTHSDAKYLAKIGTPQYDAWNSFTRDTTGKGLPYSDKSNGWLVASEWPPGLTPLSNSTFPQQSQSVSPPRITANSKPGNTNGPSRPPAHIRAG